MTYDHLQTAEDVWKTLADTEKGSPRAKILKDKRVRKLILNSGAFVILGTGHTVAGETLRDSLANTRVIQTHRLRTDGQLGAVVLDGRGNFGGLSERSKVHENLARGISIPLRDLLQKSIDEFTDEVIRPQIESLVSIRDDLVVGSDGTVQMIQDIGSISRSTVARELEEEATGDLSIDIAELANGLGIKSSRFTTTFNEAGLVRVPLDHVCDDNYAINIWDGDLGNPAFAVTPFGYLKALDPRVFNAIAAQGLVNLRKNKKLFGTNNDELRDLETLGVEGVPLFEALKHWGEKDRDGEKDLSFDYRYPHEWLSLWYKAQLALCGDPDFNCPDTSKKAKKDAQTMIRLTQEVQSAILDDAETDDGRSSFNIDFIGALALMNGGSITTSADFQKFDNAFGLPTGTLVEQHKAAIQVVEERGFEPTSPIPS